MPKTPMSNEDMARISGVAFQIGEAYHALSAILDADCALSLEVFTGFSAIFSALAQEMAEIIPDVQKQQAVKPRYRGNKEKRWPTSTNMKRGY
jgi:hypothetical protein